jgi:putative phage-type endonuclease
MEYDVTVDRDKYIGGSDVPIIMGISSFKTRWELLQEKAGVTENLFLGNKYTEYGNILEPQIRDYINRNLKNKFKPSQIINGDIRCNTDGFNGKCVLEIKTTSHIYEDVNDYKVYLVQLLLYMQENGVKKGKLAVYSRPEDLNPEFNADLLTVYDIDIKEYKTLLDEVNTEIFKFRADLERLKNNPFLVEQDFQPTELVAISNKVLEIENRMAELKTLEAEQKKVKQALFEAMSKYGVKSWETPNGIKITKVDAVAATTETVTEFDEKTFKAENEGMYAMYLHEVKKKKSGKSGYAKITMPKD